MIVVETGCAYKGVFGVGSQSEWLGQRRKNRKQSEARSKGER
jgi:hypothetical protein